MKWKQPKRIFVCSMGDLFHDKVCAGVIAGLVIQMKVCHQHTFMLLTKRPERMRDLMSQYMDKLPNVWLGVTAENQARADERIPILLSIPAAVRFVSVEPMLGPVDLREHLSIFGSKPLECTVRPDMTHCGPCNTYRCSGCPGAAEQQPLGWAIFGPENGPGARPCDPAWIQNGADHCKAAGVPFFDKRDGMLRREFPTGG